MRRQIAFYGSTPNYAFQFDDLGFPGTTDRIRALLRSGDTRGAAALIDDDILTHFAVVARWDDLADALIERYRGTAARIVTYLTGESVRREPASLSRWGAIARAVAAA